MSDNQFILIFLLACVGAAVITLIITSDDPGYGE